jgi:ABC-type spermidine/putrescine transport system permease subunit II
MKPITTIAAVLLALIASLQLLRFLLRWEVIVQGVMVPVWVSGIACVIAGAIAVLLWRESRR